MTDMPDAEAVPQEDAGPAVGTVDPVELQNALVDTQQFVIEQQRQIEQRDELLSRMQERLDELEARTTRVEDHAPPPQKITVPTLPEGAKRYRSKFTELDVVKEGAHKIIIDGQPITRGAIVAQFSGNVYQTDDPEMIAFLDNHPDNGTEFVEDPTAIRNHGDVDVSSGPRQSEQSARNPLEVPLPG